MCFKQRPPYQSKLNQMRINTLTPDLCRSSYWISEQHCRANYSLGEITPETTWWKGSGFIVSPRVHMHANQHATWKHARRWRLLPPPASHPPPLPGLELLWLKRGQENLPAYGEYQWCGIFWVLAEECIMELEWLAFVCVGRGSFTSLRGLLYRAHLPHGSWYVQTKKKKKVWKRRPPCSLRSEQDDPLPLSIVCAGAVMSYLCPN